jgi:hypothetical protein
MRTKKKPVAAAPALDCRLIRVAALEEALRAATTLRRALEDRDPFARTLDVLRGAVEAYDKTIAELKQKVTVK